MGDSLILGIDDAGRGPVIGPMILAGCLIDKKIHPELKKWGVKDSKMLTQKRREFLEKKIKEVVEDFAVVLVTPEQIEKKNEEGVNLNEVEAIAVAKIINKLNHGKQKIKVVVDCPSVSLVKWGDLLKTKIKNLSNLEISCEHKADKNHLSVSAGSILAKCMREKEMRKLKEKYGDEMGSGYPSDPLTKRFLAKYARKYANDGIFRKTWSTWKKAYAARSQKKLLGLV